MYGRRGCQGVNILRGVSIGLFVLQGVVELVGGGNSAFVGVGIKGSAIGENIIRYCIHIVGIGDF